MKGSAFGLRLGLLWLMACLALAGPLIVSCAKPATEQHTAQYHCPMHPNYVSERPGDCPICGMRLVPIEEKSTPPAKANTNPAPSPAPTIARYTCPMDPEVVSDKPGKCPKCGMALVLAKPGASAPPEGLTDITVGEQGVKLAGVQTAPAIDGGIRYSVRTVASVVVDESRVRHIHTKVPGYIETLSVNFTGQFVRKGEPILAIYSTELLASQEEYLRIRETAQKSSAAPGTDSGLSSDDLLRSARRRLELYDVPPSAIAQLDATGKAQRAVTLLAPMSGYVTAKQIVEGQQVEPGMELFTVTDLSKVWIEADFYEYEARLVKLGMTAVFTLPYDPGKELSGKVAYVYPLLNAQSRTLRVRFDFANKDLALKPGMFVNADLQLESKEGVVIPDSAVMDTGTRKVVYVDAGEGRFTPRLVTVGVRHGGQAQILAGIAKGERVVVKGNFLLDSESRIRAAIPAATAGEKK